MLHPGTRNQSDIPERRAPEVRQNGLIRLGVKPLRFNLEVFQIRIGDGPELFEVIFHIQFCIVDGILPGDAVEIEPALGQPAAGRNRLVPFRVHQDVAVRVRLGIETLGNQDRRARKSGPRFPAFVPESEHVGELAQAHHIHSQRLSQVRPDLSQHLVRLNHLDRRARLVQSQGLAQGVDRVHLHPGHSAGAQVQWNAVGFLVLKSKTYSFSRSHHSPTPMRNN